MRALISGLKKYGAEKIILFGSVARNDADEHSDTDLVVIKRSRKNFIERLGEVVPYIRVAGAVDVLVYTPEEWVDMKRRGSSFFLQVQKTGRTIFEKGKR